MAPEKTAKVALLWRGDREVRRNATPHNNRLNRVFEALAGLGVHAEPAVYADDMVSEVREQLLKLDGVLVWVDPLSDGRNRTVLDAMLRDVASEGVWISAHPDVILKMGVKEVLHRTKSLGWGTDTHVYRSLRSFTMSFRRAFDRRALVSSSKTAATAVRASGRSNSGRLPRAKAQSFASCRRSGAAYPKTCRLPISCGGARPTSRPITMWSTSRSSRDCPTA